MAYIPEKHKRYGLLPLSAERFNYNYLSKLREASDLHSANDLHAMSTAYEFAENFSHYSFGLTACGMAIISYELKLPPLGCFTSVELIPALS